MKRIEILRSVMIAGEAVKAGSLLEISDSDAWLLIGMGKAAIAAAAPEEAPAPEEQAPKRGRKAVQPTSPQEE